MMCGINADNGYPFSLFPIPHSSFPVLVKSLQILKAYAFPRDSRYEDQMNE